MIGALGRGIDAITAIGAAAAGDLLGGDRADDPLDDRDPEYIGRTLDTQRAVADLYFRPEVRGLAHIPEDGPVLLVGNHSGGTLIVDTFMFAFEFYRYFGPDRPFYGLTHDVAVKMPTISALIRKYGAVPASHKCAERALDAGAAVLVYPGGDYETYRPTWHSDRIEFGGRSGFVRLAMSKGVPIVPVVAIGGQETALFVTRGQRVARLLQLDKLARIKVFPVQLAPPFGVTVLDMPTRIPLPAQISIQVLPPIDLNERFGEQPDEEEVYEAVTGEMQDALDELADERALPLVG